MCIFIDDRWYLLLIAQRVLINERLIRTQLWPPLTRLSRLSVSRIALLYSLLLLLTCTITRNLVSSTGVRGRSSFYDRHTSRDTRVPTAACASFVCRGFLLPLVPPLYVCLISESTACCSVPVVRRRRHLRFLQPKVCPIKGAISMRVSLVEWVLLKFKTFQQQQLLLLVYGGLSSGAILFRDATNTRESSDNWQAAALCYHLWWKQLNGVAETFANATGISAAIFAVVV